MKKIIWDEIIKTFFLKKTLKKLIQSKQNYARDNFEGMQVGGLIKVKLKKKFEIDGICINKKARDENFWKSY